MSKLKKLTALGISLIPSNGLRVALYRALFGYSLDAGVQIGLMVLICVESFQAGKGVVIGRGTSFIGPMRVRLAEKSWIGRHNKFVCGEVTADPRMSHMNYAREFVMERNSLVLDDHLFDVYGLISIGAGSWVAGYASQFLTHGASAMNRDIVIGEGCYLGSAVRFTPGSGVGNRVIVGMGAVVTKRVPGDDVVVAGMPAKVVKQRTPDDAYVFQKEDW